MTMHLAHPALTTSGKKRGKKKFASAEAKRLAEQLDQQWLALKARHNIVDSPKITAKRTTGNLSDSYKLTVPAGRDTPRINSLPFTAGPCTKPAEKVYTGTKVKGIGTMHKSNAVPIFSDEEAVAISSMRR